jgi:predicted acylesterase/phospholipase RssA
MMAFVAQSESQVPLPAVAPTRPAAGSILFSRSGGGLPGLDIHAGIWQALEVSGIRSTVNAGTSAGAIAAAFDSAGWPASEFRALVASLRDRDVRAERPLWKARIPFIDWWMDAAPIRKLLEKHLPASFGALVKPLRVLATDDMTGASVSFSGGNLIDAIMASMAVSGVWPSVEIAHRSYSDGGPTANLPVPEDIAHYSQVYLCVAKRPLGYAQRRRGILSRLIWNLDLMSEDQVLDAIALVRHVQPAATVLRPDVRTEAGMLRFDHALISDAFVRCLQALPKPPEARR